MHSDTKTTKTTNGAHPRNWRSYTVHGADHPLDEVERCVAILRVCAASADVAAEGHGSTAWEAIAAVLRDTVCRLEDAINGADHTEAGEPDDGVHVATIDGKVVLQRDHESKTFAMALTREEALDLVHDLTRELGPEAGVLVAKGGS